MTDKHNDSEIQHLRDVLAAAQSFLAMGIHTRRSLCACSDGYCSACRLRDAVEAAEVAGGMMGEPTTKDILHEWLEQHGYDGLRADDAECGCELADLLVCDAPCDSCQPGYRGPDPSGECEWMMYVTREAAEAVRKRGGGDDDAQ